jgi:murein DD-endopeptidase MepM/ murein hydrolase activator NlpD
MKAFRRFLVIGIPAVIAAGVMRQHLEPFTRTAIGREVLMPFRVAALMAKPPDDRLAMPVSRVHVGQIANTWHGPRDRGRQHEGQDIFAARGTPVYSATAGIVIREGDAGIGGNAVSVLGAGGRVYYYAHLSRFADLQVGDPVTPDTIIGYVGNTGNARATPPHLHFGVYARGGAINPLPLLTDRDSTVDTTP